MAQPFKRAVGPLAWGTGALNVPLPAGYHVNDILVMFVNTAYGEDIAAAGWSHAPDSPSRSGVGGTQLNVLYRRATGSEGAITTDSGDHQTARIVAVGSVKQSGSPWDVTAKGFTGTTVDITVPGDTSTQPDGFALVGVAVDQKLDQDGFISGWTNADLASIEEIFDVVKDVGKGGGIAVISGIAAMPGVIGNTTATQELAGDYAGWFGILLADTDSGSGAEVPISEEPFSSGEEDVPPNEFISDTFKISTWQFDTPEPNPDDREPIHWYLLWQLTDQSAEARNKRIQFTRVTGKIGHGSETIHAASPGGQIIKSELENGTNFRARITLPDTTEITRYSRAKVNVRNLSIWGFRLAGVWDGLGIRDRVDEVIVEGSLHGAQK